MKVFNWFRKLFASNKEIIESDLIIEDEFYQEMDEWLDKIPECKESTEKRAITTFQAELFKSFTGKKLWEEERFKR